MKGETNSVQYTLKNYPIPFDEQVLIKQKGRPTPDFNINYSTASKLGHTTVFHNKNKIRKEVPNDFVFDTSGI